MFYNKQDGTICDFITPDKTVDFGSVPAEELNAGKEFSQSINIILKCASAPPQSGVNPGQMAMGFAATSGNDQCLDMSTGRPVFSCLSNQATSSPAQNVAVSLYRSSNKNKILFGIPPNYNLYPILEDALDGGSQADGQLYLYSFDAILKKLEQMLLLLVNSKRMRQYKLQYNNAFGGL